MRCADHEIELCPLLVFREKVASGNAREPALSRQRKLIQRHKFASSFDAAKQIGLVLKRCCFRRNQANHDPLILGNKAQRFEAAGALAIILQEERATGIRLKSFSATGS